MLVATWAAGGNLAPLLGAARLLRARGHRVTVLASSSTHVPAAEAGLDVIRYRAARNPNEQLPFEDQLEAIAATVAGRAVAEDVAVAMRRTHATLVVADCMLPAAVAAAAAARCPSVSLVHFLYGTLRENLLSGGRWWDELLPHLNTTRVGLGLSRASSELAAWEAADRILVAAPRWLDARIGYPPAVLHAGPLGIRRGSDADDGRRRRPHVLLSFSSTAMHGQTDLIGRACAAMAELDVDATLTLGHGAAPRALLRPSNVRVVYRADHDSLLPGVATVVNHAGLGTVLRSLAHGVPSVCIPLGREQPVNARRVADLGAGVCLQPKASATQIGSAVTATLEDAAYGRAARSIARRIAAAEPDRCAADFLERAASV